MFLAVGSGLLGHVKVWGVVISLNETAHPCRSTIACCTIISALMCGAIYLVWDPEQNLA